MTHVSDINNRRFRIIASALMLAAAATGCAQVEKEKLPVITTTGPHAVVLGASITVAAATTNGKDSGYAWTSGDQTIATVTPEGVVTGAAVGETTITVTGGATKAVGAHVVVVLAPDDKDQIPYYDKWLTSAHADATARAFTNWNTQGNVPVECARCHSSAGFVDYLGGDGSAAFQVDRAAPVGSVVDCRTCHNQAADTLTSVTFPSGVTLTGLGGEARCMTCHQGRSSGAAVDDQIAAAGVKNDDEISASLHFQNIHYYPAAATLYAGKVMGGYQYADQHYDVRFRHVDGFDTCTGCHDPHSTKVRFDQCQGCHTGVTNVDDAHAIRMMSSAGRDYDGDLNTSEGIHGELLGLADKLRIAIGSYGSERQTPICYTGAAYPYWFQDTDGDLACSSGEAKAANAFASWTARLLRATYNYQMAVKDPGAFAHNAKYIIQLLFDSITDLDKALVVKVDLSKAVRTDSGHFDGTGEAARHWDENEMVDATCSGCHGGQSGFRFFVKYGVGQIVSETPNGLECGTCHDNVKDTFTIAKVPSVTFPSGVVRNEPGNDNMCATCHRGRESKKTVDAQIATGKFRFLNVHYLAAAATKLGSAARVGYEYDGKTYAGPLAHTGGTQCTSCHDPEGSKHTFLIKDAWATRCKNCHADANGEPTAIRLTHLRDYDGDANATEPLAAEINGLAARVLGAMQTAAAAPGLCYAPGAYPYFFKDTDGNKVCATTEAVSSNGFAGWTPALMKAAFNYQVSVTERGGWAHNFDYLAQLLHDSIQDLGGNVTTLTRP